MKWYYVERGEEGMNGRGGKHVHVPKARLLIIRLSYADKTVLYNIVL